MPKAMQLTKKTIKTIAKECDIDPIELTNLAETSKYYVILGVSESTPWTLCDNKSFFRNYKFAEKYNSRKFLEITRL